ncbi:hypothetical protein [Rhizobium ruizarguesonis]|uniref:hypothetical protein n=1 Tax=Rhizobium ruizarguesonis TaxID=2081791 RepID=UPI0010320278|nr:hypothetical protein [Rhizobium ruizarguesonis]TAY75148.1 hypothetical protein ELH84_15370 [Rhizobium ruizarguesonis]
MNERVVAISIGDAVDREMLGFPEREVKRVLFALCTALIREGFQIAYAGDLRPGGYTYEMFNFLSGTYAGQGILPFLYVVPGSVSDNLKFEEVVELVRRTRSVSNILLVRNGQAFSITIADEKLLIGPKGPKRIAVNSDLEWQAFRQRHPYSTIADALTDARKTIASLASGCVAMGGKMGWPNHPQDQFQGQMPGVVEEALLYLKANKPFVPFGAFGGAARDIAIALGFLAPTEKTPRGQEHPGYLSAIKQVKGHRHPSALDPLLKSAATQETAEELAQLALEVMKSF